MSVKHFIFWMVASVTLVAQTGGAKKIYGIQTGHIEYGIYGGGVINPESHLSIEGVEKLFFREWGAGRIEDMERTETLYGSLKSVDKQRTLKKSENDILYTVDFDNEHIITSNLLEGDIGHIDLNHMKKAGMMNIASYDCQVWEDSTKKVCLYKGIVLLYEKSYLGFVYGKEAKSIQFDVNISEEDCMLPDYPVKEDPLMRSMITTTQTYKSESIADKIILAGDNDIAPTDKEYSKALDDLFQEVFEKEKKHLPLLLKTMRKTRACLHVAASQSDANECFSKLRMFESKFNDSSDITMISTVEDKEKILDDLDRKIRDMKTRIPCINRAANLSDLSACMK